MMINIVPRFLSFTFLLCAVCVLPAAAQTEIIRVDWEMARLQGKNRAPFTPVKELRASPDVKFSDHLRALVTLRNSSARPVEGLVLRYALSLRLLKKGDGADKAFWGVPFYVEEVRVSKINPASERQARMIRFELAEQLRKLRGSGFLPSALKMEIMLCPRLGDEPAAIKREAVIEIASLQGV